MDDILKRLGTVEGYVSDLRVDLRSVSASVPHLATKEDLGELNAELSAVTAILPHLATKEDLSRLEAGLIKWIIATVISGMALAFVIARYVAP